MSETKERIARLEERVSGIDTLFREREKQVQLAFDAVKAATMKAEEAQQRVNITQNEFRGALKDQSGDMARKEDVERLVDRVQNLERAASVLTGRSGGLSAAQTALFAILGLIVSGIGLAALFLKK
jgi:chromosome segregation ATPase